MGLFDKLLKTTIHIATTPLDIVKDVVTLGGDDFNETATEKKFKKIGNDFDEIENEIDNI